MAALASVEDYEALTGQQLSKEERPRLTLLLGWASDAVLAAANDQAIVSTVYEDVTLYNRDGRFWFPQRPVTAVGEVTVDGVTLTEGTDYRWTPGGSGRPALLIRRVSGVDSHWTCPEATVDTVTAGWATVPGPLVSVVCTLAKAVFQGSVMTPQTAALPSGAFGTSFHPSTIEKLVPSPDRFQRSVIDRYTKVEGPTSVEMSR